MGFDVGIMTEKIILNDAVFAVSDYSFYFLFCAMFM